MAIDARDTQGAKKNLLLVVQQINNNINSYYSTFKNLVKYINDLKTKKLLAEQEISPPDARHKYINELGEYLDKDDYKEQNQSLKSKLDGLKSKNKGLEGKTIQDKETHNLIREYLKVFFQHLKDLTNADLYTEVYRKLKPREKNLINKFIFDKIDNHERIVARLTAIIDKAVESKSEGDLPDTTPNSQSNSEETENSEETSDQSSPEQSSDENNSEDTDQTPSDMDKLNRDFQDLISKLADLNFDSDKGSFLEEAFVFETKSDEMKKKIKFAFVKFINSEIVTNFDKFKKFLEDFKTDKLDKLKIAAAAPATTEEDVYKWLQTFYGKNLDDQKLDTVDAQKTADHYKIFQSYEKELKNSYSNFMAAKPKVRDLPESKQNLLKKLIKEEIRSLHGKKMVRN